jgi:hypothetical protein
MILFRLPVNLVVLAIVLFSQPDVGGARGWRLVDGRHWQIDNPSAEPKEETDAREGTRGACQPGMVEVKGRMKLDGAESVEDLQSATCTEWIQLEFPERCARFDRDAWHRASEHLPTRAMHFCIDRFEFPNRFGGYPLIDVSWEDAGALCARAEARLCNEDEWTFACEGEEATPYPTGYVRDAQACTIDRPWRKVDERAIRSRDPKVVLMEIDRLWQGTASGTGPCRSASGVFDLVGNVDEWTTSVRPHEHPPILKGGYWGPVRTRCRPSTRAHGDDYASYQQGFRCCRDIE